jgi:hypothetical protein
MGTDIHAYLETFDSDGLPWVSRDVWVKDDYEGMTVPYTKTVLSNRNYDLFAILANVRNGRGFAGIVTGAGFAPMAAGRGFPEDVSAEVRSSYGGWAGDGHSTTWVTLADVLAYDWTQTSAKRGTVGLRAFARWYDRGQAVNGGPSEYAGIVGGPSVKHVSIEEMEALVAQRNAFRSGAEQQAFEARHENTYVEATWRESYAMAAGSEWWHTAVPRLINAAREAGSPDRARIVMWFDS